MSSLLKPGQNCRSTPFRKTKVQTTTVDTYCQKHDITQIDIVQIDTQGNDDAVLRGAEGMLGDGRITLVRHELTLMKLYEGQFDPLETIAFMQDRSFQIVSFYDQQHRANALGWLDILYRSPGLV